MSETHTLRFFYGHRWLRAKTPNAIIRFVKQIEMMTINKLRFHEVLLETQR